MTAPYLSGYALFTVMIAIIILSLSYIMMHSSQDVFIDMAKSRIEQLQ